jgi:transcriptional regulator with XRE-family HTH domain
MDAGETIRNARQRGGFTLRGLARLAGTSHSTLAAYESGAKVPRVDTLQRILRAAGFALDLRLERRADDASTREAKGRELADVLELAAEFPLRDLGPLRYPPFGRVP